MDQHSDGSPKTNIANLVCILIAAKKTGDRDLERVARNLLDEHGVKITLAKSHWDSEQFKKRWGLS